MVSSVQRARGPNGALTNARATASVVSYIVEVQCPPDHRSDRHDEVPDADNGQGLAAACRRHASTKGEGGAPVNGISGRKRRALLVRRARSRK